MDIIGPGTGHCCGSAAATASRIATNFLNTHLGKVLEQGRVVGIAAVEFVLG